VSTTEQLVDLARAHFRHDDVAFRIALRRIAASCRTDGARRRLLALAAEQSAPRPMQPAAPSFRASPPAPPAQEQTVPDGLLRPIKGRRLEDVRLTMAIRSEINVFLTEQDRSEDLRAHRLRPRQRLLFHGPPGNGKTTLAGAIAKELDVPGYVLDLAASTGHSYVGEQARLLQQAFGVLTNPCVLLVDEIDAVAAERSSGEGDRTGAGRGADFTVCSLLQLMDAPAKGVLVPPEEWVGRIGAALGGAPPELRRGKESGGT
jgi:hypothetical protein